MIFNFWCDCKTLSTISYVLKPVLHFCINWFHSWSWSLQSTEKVSGTKKCKYLVYYSMHIMWNGFSNKFYGVMILFYYSCEIVLYLCLIQV